MAFGPELQLLWCSSLRAHPTDFGLASLCNHLDNKEDISNLPFSLSRLIDRSIDRDRHREREPIGSDFLDNPNTLEEDGLELAFPGRRDAVRSGAQAWSLGVGVSRGPSCPGQVCAPQAPAAMAAAALAFQT